MEPLEPNKNPENTTEMEFSLYDFDEFDMYLYKKLENNYYTFRYITLFSLCIACIPLKQYPKAKQMREHIKTHPLSFFQLPLRVYINLLIYGVVFIFLMFVLVGGLKLGSQ